MSSQGRSSTPVAPRQRRPAAAGEAGPQDQEPAAPREGSGALDSHREPHKEDCERCESLPECADCEKETAVIYCPDCAESLCVSCSCRRHHPGGNKERHSVESLVKCHGPAILTPIIDELMVIYLLWCVWGCIDIRQDYLYNYTICPMDLTKNKFIAKLDVGLFKIVNGIAGATSWCGAEDVFWRHFLDVWVYGVITSADTMLHVVVTTVWAFMFKSFVLDVLGILFGFVYGILMQLWVFVEQMVIPPIPPFSTLEAFVKSINVLGGDENKECPPMTAYRRRPSVDFCEGTVYFIERHTRHLMFYWGSGCDIMSGILNNSIVGVAILRLVLLFFGGADFIQKFLSSLPWFGLGETIALHQEWFRKARYGLVGGSVQAMVAGGLPSWLTRNGLLILLPLVVLGVYFWRFIIQQQESFEERWNAGLAVKGVDVSPKECACGCVSRTMEPFWPEEEGGPNDPGRWLWWPRSWAK